jgi:6-phosphogluconolactonase (cycloisomerase 2 family)
MRALVGLSLRRRSCPLAFALAVVSYSSIVTGALAGPVLTTVGPRVALGKPSSVAFSPRVDPFGPGTRQLAATDAAANTVSVYEASPGGAVLRRIADPVATGGLMGPGQQPGAVAFSSDGGLLATANTASATVSVFSVGEDGTLTPRSIQHVGATPTSVAFSPREDVTLLATADKGAESVTLVKLSRDGAVQSVTPTRGILKPFSVAFSRDGAFLATANHDRGSVSVFRVTDTGLELAGTEPSRGAPSSVAFSPRSGLLVAANESGTASLFSVGADGIPHLTGDPQPTGRNPTSVTFSPDGELVATADKGDAHVSVFTVSETGDPVLRRVLLSARTGSDPVSVAFGGVGILATADEGGSLSMFVVSAHGSLTPVAPPMPTDPVLDNQSRPNAAAFSPNGQVLAVTHRAANTVSIFAQSEGVFHFVTSRATGTEPLSVAFNPEANRLAVANHGDDSVWLYGIDGAQPTAMPVATATIAADPTKPRPGPYSVAFSHDGSLLATANQGPNTVSVFHARGLGELSLIGTAEAQGDDPLSVAFNPVDEGLLATANEDGNSVSVFRASTSGVALVGDPATDLPAGSEPHGVAFSSDGKFLATANRAGNSLSIFSVSDGHLSPVAGPPTPTGPSPGSVAFSPRAGQRLLATSNELGNTMSLFRVEDDGRLTELGSATPTGRTPNAVAFSIEGLLATPNNLDGTVSVFALAAPALDTFITANPPPFTNATTAAFAFEANYPATFECAFQTDAFGPCEAAYATPSEGRYSFTVQARDLMGTQAQRKASYAWTVDRQPPQAPSLLEPANGASNLPSSPVFRWSPPTDAAGVVGYELWIDGAISSPAPQAMCGVNGCPATPGSPLAHGRHSWAVRSVDAAGNRDTQGARPFDVDAAPPEAFALVGPEEDAATSELRPLLSWQAAVDAGAGLGSYRVSIDDEPVAAELPASVTTFTPTADLAEGVHHWQVGARDKNGNERVSPSQQFVVDVTPPVSKLTAAPNPVLVGRPVTFDAGGSTDAGSGIVRHEWDLDGNGTFERDTGATANVTTSFAATGTVAVALRVTDRVGLTAVSRIDQRVIAVTEGESDPLGISINDGDQYTKDPKVTINAVWPKAATKMLISNDGGFAHAQTFPLEKKTPWTLQSSGPERLPKTVYVRFVRGTTTIDKDQDDIILDEKPPVVTSALLRSSTRMSLLDLRAHDRGPGGSGLAALQVANDRKRPGTKFKKLRAQRATIEIAKAKRKGGLGLNPRKKVYVRVRDKAGNVSKWRLAQRAHRR